MARPIAATPTIKGKYAKKLIEQLMGKRPLPPVRDVDPEKVYKTYLERRKALDLEQKRN